MPDSNTKRSRMAPEERQALIIDAAITTFSTSAYEETPLAHIAHAAGTSEALIHKYFDTKANLYAKALASSYQELDARQRASDQPEQATRERLRIALLTYLDFLTELPRGWATILAHPGNEPHPALEVRAATQTRYGDKIAAMIGGTHNHRDTYAIAGFFGFLAVASSKWIDEGCPDDQRFPLIDAALGSLEGALGDWRS